MRLFLWFSNTVLLCQWFPTNWKIENPFSHISRLIRNTEAQIQGENSHDIINNDNTGVEGHNEHFPM